MKMLSVHNTNMSLANTHGQISLLRAVSVWNKTTLISGSVERAGEWPHTCVEIYVMPLGSKYADL